MLQDSVDLFKSFFVYPGLSLNYMLVGIALGIAFGAIWLSAHWPPLFKKPWFWAVAVVSAFLTVAAFSFIQVPLQTRLQDWLGNTLSSDTFMTWLLLLGIPLMLIAGLVQEGAKMIPIAFWWWRSGKKIDPKLGLAIGAIAGAGYGIFEAVWMHNQMFLSGWTTQAFQTDGFLAIAGFWEKFFTVGFHIAASALVGYGLAKGKGWKFYLIAAGLHALLNYCVIFFQKGYFSVVQLETYVAVITVAVWALLLRWGRASEEDRNIEIETGAGEPTVTGTGIQP